MTICTGEENTQPAAFPSPTEVFYLFHRWLFWNILVLLPSLAMAKQQQENGVSFGKAKGIKKKTF